MDLSRRGFLGGIGLAIATPAIVKASSLMPVSARALFVPKAMLDLDGSLYKVLDYPELFAVMRNAYGGDGITTFRLPDMRGAPTLHEGWGHRIVTGAAPTVSVASTNYAMPAGATIMAPYGIR